MKQREHKRIYRLPPCPAYDVAGMEGWLSELAQQGWFLGKDGIFAGVATFERGEPKSARYRLTAAMKSTSMWADNGGAPDPEEIALGEKYNWEYVGTRGDFYIYRTFDPGTRELNTDPELQAAAINSLRKHQLHSAIAMVLGPLFSFWLHFHTGIFWAAVQFRSWFFLLTVFGVLCLFAGSLAEVISLGRQRKKLLRGEPISPACPSPRRVRAYYGRNAALLALVVVWVCFFFQRWSADILNENRTSLEDFDQPLPFATMIDFAGEGAHGHELVLPGLSYSYVETWTDWLTPVNYKWSEPAHITRADGSVLSGGLHVYYHEAVSPFVASGLLNDYIRQNKQGKRSHPLDLPPLNADFAQAFTNDIGFPTVAIRKGNTVVLAYFYQTSETYEIPLEEWAGILADSIK